MSECRNVDGIAVIVAAAGLLWMGRCAYGGEVLYLDAGIASYRDDASSTVGLQFTPTSTFTVGMLGYFDDDKDGNAVAHGVGLWDDLGNLLGTVTVQAGTASPLIGQFRYENLTTPVTLTNGITYRLGAALASGAGDRWRDASATFNLGAPVTVIEGAYSSSAGLNFPSGLYGGAGSAYIGPSLASVDYTVPVPKAALFTDPGTGDYRDDATGTVGVSLTPTQTITVAKLGFFDDDIDGNAIAHDVGVWTLTGTLLGSVTIQAGTASPRTDQFRYEPLTVPLTLSNGVSYVLGATIGLNSGDRWRNIESDYVLGAPVTVIVGRWYVGASILTFPNNDSGGAGSTFMTVNFQEVPGPRSGTVILLK